MCIRDSPSHQNQGEQKPQPVDSGSSGGWPASQLGAQEEKQGGHKQAVAGVGEHLEAGLVGRCQRRQRGGQAIIAVPKQTDEIEQSRDRQQPSAPQHPPQQIHQKQPCGAGGKIPEMVKGAVEEQQTEGGQGGEPLVVAGVEPHREVEHHRHQVEQENFLHLPPQGGKGPPALVNLAQDKLCLLYTSRCV